MKTTGSFKKEILQHDFFYIARLTKNPEMPFMVFVHGGPGLNCSTLEHLIEHESIYDSLNCNLILYDQRNCGRSKKSENPVTHTQNILDLRLLYDFLTRHEKIKIFGFIAHSYGAKLLFDFYKISQIQAPSVFLSTADSILTPRINNLAFDLAYLKKENFHAYEDTVNLLTDLSPKTLWRLTEKLAPTFQKNKDRILFYWANLNCMRKVQAIQEKLNLPMNPEVFFSVRQELYSEQYDHKISIKALTTPYLWINGFQDYIMSGAESCLNPAISPFYQSAHYPHLEEPEKFCSQINTFLTNPHSKRD